MARIVAGSVGGRRIEVPRHGVRPTSERVREALFGALDAAGVLPDAAVLDLCAGTGALGLEALSRGAGHVLFVESDRRVAAVLRRNVATLGFDSAAEVRVGPAGRLLAGPAPRGYDLVLADPPYDLPDEEVAGWLADAAEHGWLASGATVVVERPARGGEFGWPSGLHGAGDRRYGDTVLYLGYRPAYDGGGGPASIAAREERNRSGPDHEHGGGGPASIAARAAREERNQSGPDHQNAPEQRDR
jgi:16S rRNA (guanine966-N2)-methyltransferase